MSHLNGMANVLLLLAAKEVRLCVLPHPQGPLCWPGLGCLCASVSGSAGTRACPAGPQVLFEVCQWLARVCMLHGQSGSKKFRQRCPRVAGEYAPSLQRTGQPAGPWSLGSISSRGAESLPRSLVITDTRIAFTVSQARSKYFNSVHSSNYLHFT